MGQEAIELRLQVLILLNVGSYICILPHVTISPSPFAIAGRLQVSGLEGHSKSTALKPLELPDLPNLLETGRTSTTVTTLGLLEQSVD